MQYCFVHKALLLLVGLRYSPHFDFRKSTEKKKDKMIGKVTEMLQDYCLACCLRKQIDKIRMVIILY